MRVPSVAVTVAAAVVVVLLGVSCSINAEPDDETPGPEVTDPTSTTVATTSTTTTTTEAPPVSTALVTIGPARYELDALCAAGGAGEIEVSVSGTDVNGLPVVGYVRAFLGEPYVSLQVGVGADAVLFEPRLEGTLPFELTDEGVIFPEVDFVSELDLQTGEFTSAGIGTVEVTCAGYVRELPPIPFG